MPDERHEQNSDNRRDIGWLRARVADGEEERARMAAAAMSERAQLRAEVAMLAARLSDVVAMLAAQQQAAEQAAAAARAEGWRSGYDQRAEEEAQVPPPRSPGERHLRIVGCAPAAAAAGRALLRHKVALSVVAAGALVAAAVPAWHTAEFRVGVPGGGRGPSVVAQAFAPQQGRPSSPPGQGKSPSPGSSHGHGHGSPSPGPQGTPPGHASPTPSPDATTDPGTPPATPAPDPGTTDPDPSATPAAACTPG